jgi:hypothetical protein
MESSIRSKWKSYELLRILEYWKRIKWKLKNQILIRLECLYAIILFMFNDSNCFIIKRNFQFILFLKIYIIIWRQYGFPCKSFFIKS